MLTLWALAIMLAVQAGALDLSTSPLRLGALPDKITSGLPIHFPISVPDPQVPRISSIRKGSPPPRHAAGTSGGRCSPVAKYLVSSSKLNDYLNATLIPKIENMLRCEEINLAGVLGEVISTVSNSDLLSVLDLTSSLDILGGGGLGGGLGGILGKGTAPLDILGGGGLGGILGKGTASLDILGGGGLGGILGKGTASLDILGGGGLGGILGKGTAPLNILGGGGLGGILGKGTAPLDILGGGGLGGGLGGILGKGTAPLNILGGGGLGGILGKGTASLDILGGGGLSGGLGGILGKGTAPLNILGGGGLSGILGKGTAPLDILGGGGLGGILGKGTAPLDILGGGGLGGGLGGIPGKGTAPLNILGGGGLGGVLGKGGSNKSPKHHQSLLSEATGAVSDLGQEALGSLPLLGGENAVKELVNSTGLLTGNKLKETTEGILNSAVPKDVNSVLTSLLGNIDLADLLLGLEVEKVTVENMTSTMTGNGILVHAVTTAFIGGNGLAGPVVSILGFQVHADVTLQIGISTNFYTECVNLLVQGKNIEVKKVNIQIVEEVTGILPLPLPLPLEDTISQLLTVTMNDKSEESKSCGIELSDVYECKNSTGLFNYQVKGSRISAEGLSILYCAYFNQNKSPVLGRHLLPDPENVNTAVILSQMMLREIITKSAKESSVKINNLDAAITKVAYNHLPNNKINTTYWVTVARNGEKIATGQTNVIISHASEISNNKIKTTIKIERAVHSVTPPDPDRAVYSVTPPDPDKAIYSVTPPDPDRAVYSVTPPEAQDEGRDVLPGVLKRFLPAVIGNINQWNIPLGVIPNSLNGAKLQVLNSTDFQAAN